LAEEGIAGVTVATRHRDGRLVVSLAGAADARAAAAEVLAGYDLVVEETVEETPACTTSTSSGQVRPG
jgi:hypothetical protein